MTPEQQIEAQVRAVVLDCGGNQTVAAKKIGVPVCDVHQLFGQDRRISKTLARAFGWERQWVKTGAKNV